MAKEIREYRGIRDLVAAELIVDTEDELSYGEPFYIAGTSQLERTTSSSSEAHYYDNMAAIVIDSKGSDEVTCSVSAIPFDVLAKLTGQTYDEDTATLIEGESTRPYFAIGYITKDTDGNEVYVWRFKVKCSIPDETHSTENDGTDANGQEITFTGVSTIHKFSYTGKEATAINHRASGIVSEEDFFSQVTTVDDIHGFTEPSLTVSPTTLSVAVGDTAEIKATVLPSVYKNQIKWARGGKSTTDVFTMSGAGTARKVTGASAGTGEVTAIVTIGGKTYHAECEVTVTEKSATVES